MMGAAMAFDSAVAGALLSGGLGATIGSVVTAVLQIQSKKGESRANAAKVITDAAGTMVERLTHDNERMRIAILLLTDVLDEIIDDMPADTVAKERLRKANRLAKEAV